MAFCKSKIDPLAKELDEVNRFPVELMEDIRNHNFLGIHYPVEYGGLGLDHLTSFSVVKEISKGSAGIGLMFIVHWMAADVLMKYGTDEQKEKILKPIVSGQKIAAYAISESIAGSDASGIKTTAKKCEEGIELNGSKYFCTNGGIADIYIVACKTDIEAGAKGISLVILEKDYKGLEINDYADKLGCRSSATTGLRLNQCMVPFENLLGQENRGFGIAMDGLVGGRLGMAAIGLGIAEKAMSNAIDYANSRKAFGKKIAALYAIQEKIADISIGLESSNTYFEKVCHMRTLGIDYSLESSVLKVMVAQTVNKATYEAVQILGGHGYYKSAKVERYARDGRLLDIGVGSTEVLKMVIGSSVLKGSSLKSVSREL
jgi:butyryl-CoA dehydrogenase